MSRRAAGGTWSPALVTAVLAPATLALLAAGVGRSTPGDDWVLGGIGGAMFAVASVVFAVVGALVTSRVRHNPVGWVLAVMGLLIGAGTFAGAYADHALHVASPAWPGGAFAAWMPLGVPPAFGLLGVALMLVPNGRLPSRRWRAAMLVPCIGVTASVVGYALRPGPLDPPFETVANPYGLPGALAVTDALSGFGWLLMAVGVALAAVALTGRLRRAVGLEREQLKWIALAAAFAGVVMPANVASFFAEVPGLNGVRSVLIALAFIGFPVAAGIAILRYRLYDIDLVINRALVYGGLTLTLGAAYLGLVVVSGLALGRSSDLAIAGSTLGIAALFRPARARLQALVDRRFFRRRYDATRTLEAFSARLRDEVDLDALGADLRAVAAETVQPAHATLWLREGGPVRVG